MTVLDIRKPLAAHMGGELLGTREYRLSCPSGQPEYPQPNTDVHEPLTILRSL